MTTNFLPVAFLQNQFLPFIQANVSIATQALHYGTAAFGGLRGSINPENSSEVLLFRLSDHAKRLQNSAKYLSYEISAAKIEELIITFVQKNQPKQDFYIRPLVYVSDLGIAPKLDGAEKDLLIYGLYFGDYLPASGVSCCFSSWQRAVDLSVPLRGKISGSYFTAAIAKSEAVSRGFDEALMFNSSGKVCEASAMNLFMVKNGQLVTPGVEQDILEGITRQSIITVAQNLDIEVVERPIDRSELLVADEVFLTGTAAKITAVNKIENYNLPQEKPLTNQLQLEISQITFGQNSKYQDWVTRVKI